MTDFSELAPIEKVQTLEYLIKEQPQSVYELNEYLAGGVYEREIKVPANEAITGEIHLTSHLAKLVSGTMLIYDGEETGEFTGPHTFVSHPGAKRLGITLTDCVFSTFHYVGDKTDFSEIKDSLVVETIEQYHLTQEAVCRSLPAEQV
jgi:hypothetical protein